MIRWDEQVCLVPPSPKFSFSNYDILVIKWNTSYDCFRFILPHIRGWGAPYATIQVKSGLLCGTIMISAVDMIFDIVGGDTLPDWCIVLHPGRRQFRWQSQRTRAGSMCSMQKCNPPNPTHQTLRANYYPIDGSSCSVHNKHIRSHNPFHFNSLYHMVPIVYSHNELAAERPNPWKTSSLFFLGDRYTGSWEVVAHRMRL